MEIENINADFNYNMDFIEDIQAQAFSAIAKATKTQYSYSSLDIGGVYDVSYSNKLFQYIDILENIKHCNPCYSGQDIEDIIHTVKNLIIKVNG